jgi:hypothetical protein
LIWSGTSQAIADCDEPRVRALLDSVMLPATSPAEAGLYNRVPPA